MLQVIYSHRQEHLVNLLAATLREPLSHPLMKETIIVQSQGMGRWVQQQMAEHSGIAANLDLVLPAQFMWQLYRLVLPEIPEQDIWSKNVLTWRLYHLLPGLLDDPTFQVLARYLRQDSPDLRLYQLSRQVADVFDHYLIYRPEWCLQWQSVEFNPESLGENAWQAILWRQLNTDTNVPHRAQLSEQLLSGLSQLIQGKATQPEAKIPALPERISIFGIPYMPSGYLQVITELSKKVPITLFQFTPTPQYWGDITSRKTITKIRLSDTPEAAELFEEGHRLLASWGVPLRDHIDQLINLPQDDIGVFPESDITSPTILNRLQRDIFYLRQTPWEDHPTPDHSLQIHSCHSPLREVEVLYDQLQALFQNAPDDAPLDPRDVVVMTPDIGTYAPFIEAVFGAQQGDRVIPWSLADLSRTSDTPLVQIFLSFLDLLQGPLNAPDVMGILEVPAITRRLGWDMEQLEQVRRWVNEAAIRFGWDASSSNDTGLFSWQAGLQRMLLGYMLPQSMELYQELAPYSHLQSADAETLGALVAQFESWRRWHQQLKRPQAPDAWVHLLQDIVEELFAPQESVLDRQEAAAVESIREAVQEWAEELALANIHTELPFEIVKQELSQRLDGPNRRQRFLNGTVTFCAMVPMRSLPFKVVALLGMNQELFPRQDQPMSFDLIARSPRKGDRARRDEDRFLFLEALLSAREVFYLSYVGRSIKDNSERAPAVVINELLDLISEQGDSELAQSLIREHRLQPFHPSYFKEGSGTSLKSYQQDWCAVSSDADTLLEDSPFVETPLEAPDPPWFGLDNPLSLNSLLSFVGHPTRYFVRQRLNIELEQVSGLEDSEPFELAALTGYRIREQWMERVVAGQSPEQIEKVLRAKGQLPLGEWGEQWLSQMRTTTAEMTAYAEPWLQGKPSHLDFDLTELGVPLHGRLNGCREQGVLKLFAGSLRGNRWLQSWVEHLVLNILQPEKVHQRMQLIGYSKGTIDSWQLPPLPREEALGHLQQFMQLIHQSGSRPLPLFPDTALAYTEALTSGKDASNEAQRRWYNESAPDRSELLHPYNRLVWQQIEHPLDEEFESLARQIWTPILQHRTRGHSIDTGDTGEES
ncbi:exodeoxyribonuclease V subunit gamma [Hahella sp. CCB-MM4]|uniref:exodeoxyribonuclease V subunit gamma n=1 Tax=Hahella sp. (strain CCB-MM4) TaxID=1926491 RepID=UPI000B9B7D36|nr:exodeoxyribonuclease V subunit gamma [Hahella sp. CCB-MM4]OZG74666.1 exodeoxyribonuclease V subunit gamma [Hahella sp. CCB-MM4]